MIKRNFVGAPIPYHLPKQYLGDKDVIAINVQPPEDGVVFGALVAGVTSEAGRRDMGRGSAGDEGQWLLARTTGAGFGLTR